MGEHYSKWQASMLSKQLGSSPYADYRQYLKQIGAQQSRTQQKTEQQLRREGVPLGARVELMTQQQQAFQQQAGSTFTQVQQQEEQRRRELMQQLAGVEAQIEDAQEAADKQKLGFITQAAGTVLGAGVGFYAGGGVGAALGASLGAGLGQVAGGAMTEQWDMALAGVGQTVSSFAQTMELSSSRNMAAKAQTKMEEIRKLYSTGSITEAEASILNAELNNVITYGGKVEDFDPSAWLKEKKELPNPLGSTTTSVGG